ncbi:hypothetical protein ACJX0J_040626, partial [Zea mays]
ITHTINNRQTIPEKKINSTTKRSQRALVDVLRKSDHHVGLIRSYNMMKWT